MRGGGRSPGTVTEPPGSGLGFHLCPVAGRLRLMVTVMVVPVGEGLSNKLPLICRILEETWIYCVDNELNWKT